jgi:TPR repeat protein
VGVPYLLVEELFANKRYLAWGDGDALAEAGFCYAQGIGCKKDLKKSARFYRLAESKGISMVGNSWCVLLCNVREQLLTLHRIYKNKYKDNDQDIATEVSGKKTRNKSRTRTMFGRMKSVS